VKLTLCEATLNYKSQNLQERAQNKQTHSKASQQSLMAGTKNQHQVVYTKPEYQTTTELKLYQVFCERNPRKSQPDKPATGKCENKL
jgi:hypothetical protein